MEDSDEQKKRKHNYWPLVLAALGTLRLGRVAGEHERPTPLDELADVIFALNAAAYEEALRQTVAAAGGDAEAVTLANRVVLTELRRAAEESARSIVETYQADLERMLGAMPADVEPQDIPGLIEQWSAERGVWKVAQIARTEVGKSAGQALRNFITYSGAKGLAWFGGSLKCEICQRIAGGNPYPLDDPQVGVLGHISCLDHWETRLTNFTSIWLGE